MSNEEKQAYSSLFWPVILIGVGVIWLLGNLGVIGQANIAVLFRLWPLLLILIGLDILFGRRSKAIGALLGLGALALAIVLMLVGPGLGLVPDMEVKERTFTETLNGAESAEVILNLSVGTNRIETASDDLIRAELTYIGEVTLTASGESRKRVVLDQEGDIASGLTFNPFGWFGIANQGLRWEVWLHDNTPMSLELNGGVGDTNANLERVRLENLTANTGVGEFDITLPGGTYDVKVNSGVGTVILDVPESSGVELIIHGGIGGVNVPGHFDKVTDGDNFLGDEGTWRSENYESAETRIRIEINKGIGDLTIR